MKLVTLTPHAIVLRATDGTDTTIPSSGVARVAQTSGALEDVPGVPVPVAGRSVFGEVIGLPAPAEGTLYIVSLVIAGALAGSREDCVCPGTGPADGAVRENGQIVAVTRLVRA